MADLIDTTEMYLKTILELEEEGTVPLRARIAERLDHAGPSVSQTVARMERDGLVHVAGDRHLELTDVGRTRAEGVMRKHRLAERLLADVVGLDWAYVHDEACRWEHVMSERVERRLVDLLEHPVSSPYGNPIPALDALDADRSEGTSALGQGEPLSTALDTAGIFTVLRLTEAIQTDSELLAELSRAGIRPGALVSAAPADGYVAVHAVAEDGTALDPGLEVSAETAAHLRGVRRGS